MPIILKQHVEDAASAARGDNEVDQLDIHTGQMAMDPTELNMMNQQAIPFGSPGG
jgi:hypothetical protein